MASLDPAIGPVYEIGNDQVPEVYRDFFKQRGLDRASLHGYGSWVFFIIAVVAHIFVWAWRRVGGRRNDRSPSV